ncbi:uncharacterized protein LOC122086863 [Macadamia integrifolia]|uniref:uncharacterized protein LOC122086863 n=1 Tax=Macadamia integrifolia TaxID=60698 RepID=UPI001C4EAA64|nr:uncharacterized protein LOC122086863 [Macadamia integrifolia]
MAPLASRGTLIIFQWTRRENTEGIQLSNLQKPKPHLITMAASYLAKNALIINVSKSFPQNPSLSLQCFCLSLMTCYVVHGSQQDRNEAEEMSKKTSNMSERVKDIVKEGTERAKDTAKQKAREFQDSTSDVVGNMKENTKQGMERTTETAHVETQP